MHGLSLFLAAAAFVCLWSSGWTVSHYAIADSSALSILSARYVMVVALLLIVVTVMQQWQRISYRELAFHLLISVSLIFWTSTPWARAGCQLHIDSVDKLNAMVNT